ncbi:MAG: SRPBCC family protein, partial [Solirubrobacterales bacterium]
METAQTSETVVVEKLINASAETVWQLWTDEAKIADWFVPATIDPREGGEFTLELQKSEAQMRGHFTEFSPYERLAFTWGMEEEWFGVPPESTNVTV